VPGDLLVRVSNLLLPARLEEPDDQQDDDDQRKYSTADIHLALLSWDAGRLADALSTPSQDGSHFPLAGADQHAGVRARGLEPLRAVKPNGT
jgi:hypothetical protein